MGGGGAGEGGGGVDRGGGRGETGVAESQRLKGTLRFSQ